MNKHLRSPSGRLVGKVALGATATMLAVTAAVGTAGDPTVVALAEGLTAPGVEAHQELTDQRATREDTSSRSIRRATKKKATRADTGKQMQNEVIRKQPKPKAPPAPVVTGGTPSSNRELGMNLCADAGFSASQCADLGRLWERESGWDHKVANSSSGAFGIPQSLPGSKMASAGGDWRTNPATQIKWGLGYIKARYGNPSSAWAHSQSHGWY